MSTCTPEGSLTIFDIGHVTPDDQSLRDSFLEFHRDNPHVYQELVLLARRARRAGAEKVGIGMLWEVLRWRNTLRTSSADGLKLNNNHRAYYARLIMASEPDLDGLFDVRRLNGPDLRVAA